jgi:HD-GYP domain-containing protein (c-di-GMP phosphodiesterase class II)
MRMLHKLTSDLVRLREESSVAECITANLHGLIDYHNCRIYLLEQDGLTLGPVWFRGELSEYQGETYEALLVHLGEGITGRCVERGETILLENTADCEFAVQIPGTPEIDESMLAVPLRYRERVIGAIVLSKLGIAQFDQEDQRLLEVLAGNAATAFENARLARGEREAAQTLERAYLSTVEALANALEAKDEYTGDHARALAEMAIAVGRQLGIRGDRLKMLELAALFHDIGKIGVASEIIRKPGRLSAAERSEMERHPDIGARILAPVPFLQAIRPIVRACHERWDGRGYPGLLRGGAIPLEARIILVCDAYHAMTTDRPYRRALPPGEAERRLRDAAGTQFDPTVVERFLQLLREGRIRSAHPPVSISGVESGA